MEKFDQHTGEPRIVWAPGPLRVELDGDDGPVTVRSWACGDRPGAGGANTGFPGQPAVEVLTVAEGRARDSQRLVDTEVGRALRLVGWDITRDTTRDATRHGLRVTQAGAGLTVAWELTARSGIAAATAVTTVRNDRDTPVVLLAVTSLALLVGTPADDLDLLRADSSWLAEGRWCREPLRAVLPDLSLAAHDQDSRSAFPLCSRGAWPTAHALPVGVLVPRAGGTAMAWQVEHNGPWRWEVGDSRAGPWLAAGGPNDADHQWSVVLAPGESFTSVPATLAVGDGLDGAVAALTAHRRAVRRPTPGPRPVVFNDFMNTLMGDPTTERLLPLVDAAAEVGAEVFCVDAGWYAADADWWDAVGEWTPATSRFPGGLGEVLDRIRAHGMTPGLWLEPEAVGVRSPVAAALPAEAFFTRHGLRWAQHGRHQLDLRHPAARAHLDGVVDRIVGELGAGYLKLDDNTDPGPGTDHAGAAPGAGLLGHQRAQLDWVRGVLDRHPGLLLENCASGAMRADPASLAAFALQSTSDQQDPLRYPPIAAAAPLAMPPEQAASWAYPQPDMTDEQIAFTLCTTMLGHGYLSGRLDAMTAAQRRLVAEGVAAHRAIRPAIATASPTWPLGLPAWDDAWVALALHPAEGTGPPGTVLMTAWRRDGAAPPAALALPALAGRAVTVRPVFPTSLPAWPAGWDADRGVLTLAPAGSLPGARTLALHAT